MNSKNTFYKQNTNIVVAEIDSEYCLFSSESAEYFNLNKSASKIWSLLEETIEFDKILEKLVDDYDVNSETCKKDLKHFLDTGVELGFIFKT